jgi:hypothetical protein
MRNGGFHAVRAEAYKKKSIRKVGEYRVEAGYPATLQEAKKRKV